MKVYISSREIEKARALARTLTGAGHTVVSTWHEGSSPPPPKTDAAAWVKKADGNFEQIEEADALVLIGGDDKYPGGKYVEAGYAHAMGLDVYNLYEVGNGMMNVATPIDSVQQLLDLLEE